MYNVSDAYLEAIKRPVIKYSITGTIGSNNFNAYTIKEGSFQITNQCTDTNELSLGSCAIGQLKATFCDISIIRNEWLDKVITPSCRVEVSEGQYESVPLGVFTIKQAEQTAEGVQVTAYDNMFKFDKLFDATDKDFDKTGKPYYFLNKICQKCGVTLGMTQNEVNALPNGDNTMYICGVRNGTTDYANDIETYRDALFYLAQACACFATINRLGRLELRPFRQSVTDYISDTDRLAGAEFADYVTSFTGIYVDSLYDGRTTFYGYDLEKLQENLVEYTARKEDEEDAVDEDEADIDEIQEKYDQGQITEEQYVEQMAAATKKLKEDQAKLKATNKYLNWLNKAIAKAQANAQGTIMDLEGNPFLQHRDSSIRSIAKVTTATELRTTIMRRLSKMEYVPFSCSSVFGIHYDLGDRIMFTDGHADDDLGCITAFDWTYNGEYSMYGYGANPDEATVRPKIEKAMKQANENALNRPDLELVELEDSAGDPKPVAIRKKSASSTTGENWISKVIYVWSYYKYSAGSVPQSGITRVKVSCTSNFAICTVDPGHDVYPGDQDNIVNGIKRHDLIIHFVGIQIPNNELDSYEMPKIKFECTRVYAPDPEHALDVTPQTFGVPEGQDTMQISGYKTVQDPDDIYLYWRLPTTSIMYGSVAHGIAEEYNQESVDFYFNSISAWQSAGVIFLDTIPNIMPGDVVLPTASGQKQTAADVENIARKIAGAGSDPSEYVSPSYFDDVSVGGGVDVENKNLSEKIGEGLGKIFTSLNECIRKIYKPTEEGGITVDYPEYYYHGGSANRLFNRVDYEGHDYATIGSDVPTLIADEYTRQELTALPGGTHLEDRYASGKTYIRVGDKSGMRLVGEAGQNKAHANEPYSYYLWDNHKTTRALESTGYRIDSYRVDGSSNAQYLAYRLTGIEGGKTYNISFDFGVLPSERPPGHESDIYFSHDDTKPFGMLLTTNPSFNDFGSLPVDSDVWHDDDPNNMYYAFAGSFTPVTAALLPHYEFSFTAQEDKSYYIFFVTNRLSSEIQSGTYTYTMHMKLRNFISSEGLGLIDAEISFCNNPSVSSGETWFKWDFTNGGGGGTSDLDAIEITYADYQLLTPEEKADPDKIYFITDYPSGNMALDDLTDVDITTPTEGQILTYDDTDDEWKNTDVDDIAPTVTEASARANLASGDTLGVIIGKIKKWFSDLKDLAFTAIDGAGSTKYLRGDGTWQAFPTIPTVNNGTLTIKRNNTSVGTFTANQSTASNINIECATPSDIEGSKTVTGSVVTVNTAPIYAEEVDVAVVATQSGSGTPSPNNIRYIQPYDIVSVDRTGINVWDEQWEVGDIDATTGQNKTASIYIRAKNYIRVKPNETYYFKVSQYSFVFKYNKNKEYLGYIDPSIKNNTFTVPSDTEYIRFVVGNAYGTTYNNDISINYPSTDTSYHAFNGQTVSLQLGNKNLLPMTVKGIKAANTTGTWSGNVYSINNGTITVLTDKDGCIIGLKANGSFNGNTTIYLTALNGMSLSGSYIISTSSVLPTGCYISVRGGASIDISPNESSKAFTANGTSYITIYIPSGASLSNYIYKPMLRSASVTDPTFSPYNPTLGGMVYGGQLTIKDDGSAVFVGTYGKKKISELSWGTSTSSARTFYADLSGYLQSENIDVISSAYNYIGITNVGSASLSDKADGSLMFFYNATQLVTQQIYIKDMAYTDAASFKSGRGNEEIVYELATPFTIHLSAEQLKLLQGTNNVWSNAGDVTLKYQPDNVIGEAIGVSEDYTEKYVRKFHSKNIIPMTVESIKSINGNASSWNGNTFTSGSMSFTLFTNDGVNVTGIRVKNTTASPGTDSWLRLIPDGKYMNEFSRCILNGCSLNNENVGYIAIRGMSSGYKYYVKNTVGDSVIDDIPDDVACQCYIYATKDTVFDTIIYPMIRKPDTDNAYAIPQPTDKTLLNMIAELSKRVSALE